MRFLDNTASIKNIKVESKIYKLDKYISFRPILNSNDVLFFWDKPGLSIVAKGTVARITASGPKRFQKINKEAKNLFNKLDKSKKMNIDNIPDIVKPKIFGGFSFHPSTSETEKKLRWKNFYDAEFILPEIQLTSVNDRNWLTVNSISSSNNLEKYIDEIKEYSYSSSNNQTIDTPKISKIKNIVDKEQWCNQVSKILENIDKGDTQKVVFAQALSVELDKELDIPDILLRLSYVYPKCYKFMFRPSKNQTFFGATPEKLVSMNGRKIETQALASSAPRGKTFQRDEKLSKKLLNNKKQLLEHNLVLEAIKQQLNPIASQLDISSRNVRKLKNIQHIETQISGKLNSNKNIFSLLESLHPTPAVGGLPPKKALKTIKEIEPFDRGWYASPIGWIDLEGNGSFIVGIRSGLNKDKNIIVFAGAGIVEGSIPEKEWEETKLKFPIIDEIT